MFTQWDDYRICRNALTIAALTVGFFSCAVRTIVAQDQSSERSFVMEDTRPNDPLQIVGFSINGTTLRPIPGFSTEGRMVNPGVSFQATEEAWLKTSFVVVRNVSKKTVSGIWITLLFPEFHDDKGIIADHVQIGNVAASEEHTISGRRIHETDNPSFTLLPGQTAEIHLGMNYDNTSLLEHA